MARHLNSYIMYFIYVFTWKRLAGLELELEDSLVALTLFVYHIFVCIFLHIASAMKYPNDGKILIALPEMCAAGGWSGTAAVRFCKRNQMMAR